MKRRSGTCAGRFLIIPVILILGLGWMGCRSETAREEASLPDTAGLPDGVLAVVDGTEITADELRTLLERLSPGGSHGGSYTAEESLEQLITAQVLEAEARRSGYAEDAEVLEELAAYRHGQLAALYVETLRREYVGSQEVPPEDLEKMGQLGTLLYDTEVILLPSLEEAPAVYRRLKEGEKFSEVARDVSSGITAEHGGNLGPRPVEYFLDMFGLDIEAQNLRAGDVSNPIETGIGYVVIHLRGIQQQGDVVAEIEQMILVAQEQQGGRKFDKEIYPELVRTIPVVWNGAYLEEGKVTPAMIDGTPGDLPEGVYARLADFEINAAMLTDMGPELVTPAYDGPPVTNLIENVLIEKHFVQELRRKRPALEKDEGLIAAIDRQKGLFMRKKLVRDRVEEKIVVAPAEAERYYRDNIGQFRHGKLWDLYHLLVNDRKTANEVVKFFHQGMDFRYLARQYSTDTLKEKGGYLGLTRRGQIIPPLDLLLEDLDEGELSPIVETDAGFHLLYCGKVRPAEDRSFEESLEDINQTLWSQQMLKALKAFQQELRAKADIRINQVLLAEIAAEEQKKESHFPVRRPPPSSVSPQPAKPAGHP